MIHDRENLRQQQKTKERLVGTREKRKGTRERKMTIKERTVVDGNNNVQPMKTNRRKLVWASGTTWYVFKK
jgi:hypothetical protein